MNERITPEQLWAQYRQMNPELPEHYDSAFAFGAMPDELAQLVLHGVKTATASDYALYELFNEELPTEGGYDIVLDSNENAVCVIHTTRVYTVSFNQVDARHAYKEGEDDRTLASWRRGHEAFFTKYRQEYGLEFSEDMLVVCEEFEKVFPL